MCVSEQALVGQERREEERRGEERRGEGIETPEETGDVKLSDLMRQH